MALSLARLVACTRPVGYVADDHDCDDHRALTNPAATELCNGFDDDCDSLTDEPDAADAATWHADSDGDGFGNAASPAIACDRPDGHAKDSTDCDDTRKAVHPGATEVCNGLDDDCDGLLDDADPSLDLSTRPTWYKDADGDQ